MNLSVGPTAQKEVPGGGRKQETAFYFLLTIKNKNQSRSMTSDNIPALQRSVFPTEAIARLCCGL